MYAVESFLIARRLMYWQVYLHKTVLAGDQVLHAAIHRARMHLSRGHHEAVDGLSPALAYFLSRTFERDQIQDDEVLHHFCLLDDTDVLYSLKRWTRSPDPILADLSRRFIERDFFRCTFLPAPPSVEQRALWQHRIAESLVRQGLSDQANATLDASFYLTFAHSRHSAYERVEGSICVIDDDGTVRELSEMTDARTIEALTQFVVKPYVCYPKEVPLEAMIDA